MSFIGIDLGTTFSCVAYVNKDNVPEVIANFNGKYVTPSVVAYTENGELVGETAVEVQAVTPYGNVIYDAKRFIGRQYNDASVQADMKRWRFKLVDRNGKPHVKLTQNGREKYLAAEQISAEILKKMRECAEAHLKTPIKNAVITVPASFDQRQRQETLEAARLAGLSVLKLVNEPTAAAIAYGMRDQGNKTVLIFDLGGGTFDVSVLKCHGGGYLEILSCTGHMHIGGQDFDELIINYVIEEYNRTHDVKFPEDKPRLMRRLMDACINAKIALSAHDTSVPISIDWNDGNELNVPLTRMVFNQLIRPVISGTMDIVEQALERASLTPNDIDHVILAGGSTRVPLVKELLAEKFPLEKLWCRINPDEAVALGAAVIASTLQENTPMSLKLKIKEITPLSLGIELRHGLFDVIIPRGTVYPCKNTESNYGTAVDNESASHVVIFEGERSQASLNRKIGEVTLNLKNQRAKRGYDLSTTFEIDGNGILHVTELEVANGNCAHLETKYDGASHREADIERIISEAEAYREEDGEFRRQVRELTMLEDLAYTMKSSSK